MLEVVDQVTPKGQKYRIGDVVRLKEDWGCGEYKKGDAAVVIGSYYQLHVDNRLPPQDTDAQRYALRHPAHGNFLWVDEDVIEPAL